MNKNKLLKTGISLALVGVTIITPVSSSVYATNTENISIENNLETIDDYKNIEEYIREKYGNEDKFVIASRYENTYSEINSAKGIIRVKNIDEKGNENIVYEVNIFESAREIAASLEESYQNDIPEIESRKSIVYKKQMTGSPIDKYSLAVFAHGNYNSHFRIQIGNKNGKLSNYYKNNSWETGNTAKFKKSLISAQGNVSAIKKKLVSGGLFAAAMSALNKFLIGTGQIDKAAVVTVLQTVGVTAVTAVAVGGDAVAYLINARNCGSYYNAIIKGTK